MHQTSVRSSVVELMESVLSDVVRPIRASIPLACSRGRRSVPDAGEAQGAHVEVWVSTISGKEAGGILTDRR
jgi:hypothetical protein